MTEKATVLAVHEDSVDLKCLDEPHCDSCSGAFCTLKSRTLVARAPSELHLEAGDEVEVFVPPSRAIASGFLVLIVPLIFFLGAYLALGALESEPAKVGGGFAGLLLGFLLVYLVGKRRRTDLPAITRVSSRKPGRTNRPPALSLREE